MSKASALTRIRSRGGYFVFKDAKGGEGESVEKKRFLAAVGRGSRNQLEALGGYARERPTRVRADWPRIILIPKNNVRKREEKSSN